MTLCALTFTNEDPCKSCACVGGSLMKIGSVMDLGQNVVVSERHFVEFLFLGLLNIA